jgi:hypothetical protein
VIDHRRSRVCTTTEPGGEGEPGGLSDEKKAQGGGLGAGDPAGVIEGPEEVFLVLQGEAEEASGDGVRGLASEALPDGLDGLHEPPRGKAPTVTIPRSSTVKVRW